MKRNICLSALVILTVILLSLGKNANETKKPAGTWALEFSPDDQFFALGGDDSVLHIYNAASRTLHKHYQLNGMIKNIAWHQSGNIIAIATLKNVLLLDVKTGKLFTIPDVTGARGMAWNNSGEMLGIAGGGGMIFIVNEKGNLITSFKKHDTKSYLTLDWSADNTIATGSDEIILFDTAGRQLVFIDHRKEYKTGVLTVRWHPSGEFFVSGDYGHEGENIPTNLQFRKKDGSLVRTINGHHSEIRNARWNKEGRLLATASDALRIYNEKGDLLATGKTPGNYIIWSVAWSNDGKTILTSSFGANHLDVWDKNGKHLEQVY
jgi:WD40 repeat protein